MIETINKLMRVQKQLVQDFGREATPEEIAEAIDYLIRAEWTSGTSIVVDGGLSLGMASF